VIKIEVMNDWELMRRELLTKGAGLTGAAFLAGCSGGSGEGSTPEATESQQQTEATQTRTDTATQTQTASSNSSGDLDLRETISNFTANPDAMLDALDVDFEVEEMLYIEGKEPQIPQVEGTEPEMEIFGGPKGLPMYAFAIFREDQDYLKRNGIGESSQMDRVISLDGEYSGYMSSLVEDRFLSLSQSEFLDLNQNGGLQDTGEQSVKLGRDIFYKDEFPEEVPQEIKSEDYIQGRYFPMSEGSRDVEIRTGSGGILYINLEDDGKVQELTYAE